MSPDNDYDLYGNFLQADADFGIETRGLLQTHAAGTCAGEFCCLHNPSDHPLRDAPLNWRADRGHMERKCRHGVGHPDPDSLAYLARIWETEAVDGSHGCDGCCR